MPTGGINADERRELSRVQPRRRVRRVVDGADRLDRGEAVRPHSRGIAPRVRHRARPAAPAVTRMTRVVTFGEVMLRLKSPGFERLFQSPTLEATFGGAEANVAASLAQFGVDARFVSAIPANNVGDACLATLRAFGVDTSTMRRRAIDSASTFSRTARTSGRRASRTIAPARRSRRRRPRDFDLDAIFDGADWFHVSGVTPAISASAAELSIAAARAARERWASPSRATTTIARISGVRQEGAGGDARARRATRPSASPTKRTVRRRSASRSTST